MNYALLFSGMSFRRHVNGLEFCYRTLVDRLGFAPGNIQVLNYDGSLRAFGDLERDSSRPWPGDRTAYRMTVNAAGSRDALQQALRSIAAKLGPDDQLFINTCGHGGHHGTASGPDLIAFPHCQRFQRHEFCAAIAALPPHRSLVVLMSQCFSGGFNQAILDASPAASTAVAAAAAETRPSCMSFEDRNWDSFQRNYIAALAGRDVDGSAIPLERTGSADLPVTVREAFTYASTCPLSNPFDAPQFSARPEAAGSTTLVEYASAPSRAA